VIGSVPFRGGLTLQSVEGALATAFSFKRATTVALSINSPGGSPVQSSLIAKRIRDLADEKQKRVLAFVEDIAASGGYWVALAADEIFVDRASIVGSIGVISAGFGFDQAIARVGVERRVHATGPRKSLLDPFQPEEPGDLEVLRELHADILASFKSQLRVRREGRLSLSDDILGSGRVWSGEKAVEHGLADGIGDIRAVLRGRFGKNIRLKLVSQQRGWLHQRFRIQAPPTPAACLQAIVPELLTQIEAQALWKRYGL
jgi:serine protease SohB